MTRGGPTYSTEVLATMLYRQAFELNEMGTASAIAVILVALVLGTAWLQTLLLREGGTSLSRVSVSAPRVGMRPGAGRLERPRRAGGGGRRSSSSRSRSRSRPASTC